MDHPKILQDTSEYVLNDKEIAAIDFLPHARKIAADAGNILPQTEVISREDKFGYIFRYDIVESIEDDGSFHPEDGMKGTMHTIRTRVVVSTKEGKEYLVVTSII